MKFTTLLAGWALSVSAVASEADPLRVRGTITAVDGNTVTVENAAGQTTEVALDEPVVLWYTDIAMDDVADDAYIAVPSIDAPDGHRRALAIIVFPDALRGLNEGIGKGWDLTPGSKMTNAAISQITARGGENIITVASKGEQQTIYVPPMAPITKFVPASDKTYTVGDNVVIFADDSSGTVTGKFVGMHENGGLPPV